MELRDFKDIHTHDISAGDDSIINLHWGADVPDHGYYSVGIHPWHAADATEADFERLAELAANPRVVAIGEAGLDALRGAPIDVQRDVFVRHVQISERTGKPLIIHAVRTLSEIMRLRKLLKPRQQWVIHGFRGKPATAAQLLAHGIDISLGKKYNPAVPGCVPADRLYRESDADACQ